MSDSGAAPYLPYILQTVRPKTLIIERPRADVVASLVRYFGRPELEAQIDQLLAPMVYGLQVESDLVRRVPFAELSSLEVVEAALAWLEVKPAANLAQLLHMRIESDLCYNLEIVRQRAA